ncbi:NADPH-dependent FMN reductase [Paraburkholderia sp. 2C]|jgi:NAD(P)H-dependent FMN reductase
MVAIAVIAGSTRENRFSEQPARWIFERLNARDDVEAQWLDLRDFPMPFFDQAVPPSWPGRPPYEHPIVKRWTAEIARADGFVIVTPEYNHGSPAVLKNAMDWVKPEWRRKAAAFVSYGAEGGARSVEHLRATLVELQVAPVQASVHIPASALWQHFQGKDVTSELTALNDKATTLIEELLWWTQALKAARSSEAMA